jgi:hypothetical protein
VSRDELRRSVVNVAHGLAERTVDRPYTIGRVVFPIEMSHDVYDIEVAPVDNVVPQFSTVLPVGSSEAVRLHVE